MIEEILDYLSKESGADNYYLESLNNIEYVNLDIYKNLGEKFSTDVILKLFREANWRPKLIAYTYVLASGKKEYLQDIKEALNSDCFVAPQLIVAVAVLGKRESGAYLKELLKSPNTSSKSKGAIIAALPYCYVTESDFNAKELRLGEFGLGFNIAYKHLVFWHDYHVKTQF